MTRNAQDIIDDMRNIVKPIIAKMLFEANFEGFGKEDKAEFETEFEMILTSAEMALKQAPCDDVPDTNKGNIYVCSCGYGWDKSKVVRHHFCPNCGAKVVEPTGVEGSEE